MRPRPCLAKATAVAVFFLKVEKERREGKQKVRYCVFNKIPITGMDSTIEDDISNVI